MFENRKDAGQHLARAAAAYTDCEGIVLGIPRGGVQVGAETARRLNLPFALVIVRKLPFPDNPEAGFGAIAEDGSLYLQPGYTDRMVPAMIDQIRRRQTQEIQRRIQVLRRNNPLPRIEGKTVLLVDDGIAMGSTMTAAARLCRHRKAAKIIAAAPVAGPDAVRTVSTEVDEIILVENPPHFRAVADYYRYWYDVSDAEVLRILQEYAHENRYPEKDGPTGPEGRSCHPGDRR